MKINFKIAMENYTVNDFLEINRGCYVFSSDDTGEIVAVSWGNNDGTELSVYYVTDTGLERRWERVGESDFPVETVINIERYINDEVKLTRAVTESKKYHKNELADGEEYRGASASWAVPYTYTKTEFIGVYLCKCELGEYYEVLTKKYAEDLEFIR